MADELPDSPCRLDSLIPYAIRHLLKPLNRPPDVVLRRPRVDRAETQDGAVVEGGGADHRVAVGVHRARRGGGFERLFFWRVAAAAGGS